MSQAGTTQQGVLGGLGQGFLDFASEFNRQQSGQLVQQKSALDQALDEQKFRLGEQNEQRDEEMHQITKSKFGHEVRKAEAELRSLELEQQALELSLKDAKFDSSNKEVLFSKEVLQQDADLKETNARIVTAQQDLIYQQALTKELKVKTRNDRFARRQKKREATQADSTAVTDNLKETLDFFTKNASVDREENLAVIEAARQFYQGGDSVDQRSLVGIEAMSKALLEMPATVTDDQLRGAMIRAATEAVDADTQEILLGAVVSPSTVSQVQVNVSDFPSPEEVAAAEAKAEAVPKAAAKAFGRKAKESEILRKAEKDSTPEQKSNLKELLKNLKSFERLRNKASKGTGTEAAADLQAGLIQDANLEVSETGALLIQTEFSELLEQIKQRNREMDLRGRK